MGVRMLAALAVGAAVAARAGDVPEGWTTYRSERFGYAIAYPPETTLKAYFDGQSADLLDAEGRSLVALEVWPPDLCPRLAATPKDLGIRHAIDMTQADGADGSSVCDEPVRVRESTSGSGVHVWELALACIREEERGTTRRPRVERTREGRKGPTFFADVSQTWKPRVLMVDPAGVDPRLSHPAPPRLDAAVVRTMLDTLATFALPDPQVVCIEDLGRAAGSRATGP
jgi:hypothetical protein